MTCLFFFLWYEHFEYKFLLNTDLLLYHIQAQGCITMGSRLYAHRTRPSILVQSLRLQNPTVSSLLKHYSSKRLAICPGIDSTLIHSCIHSFAEQARNTSYFICLYLLSQDWENIRACFTHSVWCYE